MNESLLEELPGRHARRIIAYTPSFDAAGEQLLVYCTSCAFYKSGDLLAVTAGWAEHIEAVEEVARSRWPATMGGGSTGG